MRKEHGMLFADRLMPPLLDGRKTQTRRPVKCSIDFIGGGGCNGPEKDDPTAWGWENEYGEWFTLVDTDWSHSCCPYKVGDLIWARETWLQLQEHHWADPMRPFDLTVHDGRKNSIAYRASTTPDGDSIRKEYGYKWRPSIHMPKWACRCWLEITDVRVQRIQDISEEDAIAEGAEKQFRTSVLGSGLAHIPNSYRGGFANSWSKIYPGTWEENIWVWALTFKRIEK